jgi:hypothetical protein
MGHACRKNWIRVPSAPHRMGTALPSSPGSSSAASLVSYGSVAAVMSGLPMSILRILGGLQGSRLDFLEGVVAAEARGAQPFCGPCTWWARAERLQDAAAVMQPIMQSFHCRGDWDNLGEDHYRVSGWLQTPAMEGMHG